LIRFIEQGANVVLADINIEGASDLMARFESQIAFKKTDLTKPSEISELVEFAVYKFGAIDIIINNARPRFKGRNELSNMGLLNGWEQGIDVLLKAPLQLVEFALPYLKKSSCRAIVNIGSTNASFVSSQPLVYHVAKSGLVQMTRYLAYELGVHGIRINCVSPGLIDFQEKDRSILNIPINKKIIESFVPMRRASTISDIADAVLFLCSSSSKYINGHELVLDGGAAIGDHFDVLRNAIENRIWE
jgi:3-oxoacyl-[acyl-carrier protein] reductase